MILALSRTIHLGSQSPAEKFVRVVKSPLITTLAIITLTAFAIPLKFTLLGLFPLTLIAFAAFPSLRKKIIYEIAIADLIVRDTLSHYFPKLNHHWWHRISENLFLGGIPLQNRNHSEQLKRLGIGAVCAILEDWEAEDETFMSVPVREDDWNRLGIEYRRFSCPDMEPLELPQISDALDWIDRRIAEGKIVYVNCKAGRGRSAMVHVCRIIKSERLSFKDAFQRVRNIRSVVHLNSRQRERVQEYQNTMAFDI